MWTVPPVMTGTTASVNLTADCSYCGALNGHRGMWCPRIKSMEYFENGVLKRVEFHSGSNWRWE